MICQNFIGIILAVIARKENLENIQNISPKS